MLTAHQGGNIGGFIAEGPDGEQRLVFCSDAVTPTTNTAGGVVQMNVSGSLAHLPWKYSELTVTACEYRSRVASLVDVWL